MFSLFYKVILNKKKEKEIVILISAISNMNITILNNIEKLLKHM